jgi:ribosomal-protein-alanine N-acetyltransferase
MMKNSALLTTTKSATPTVDAPVTSIGHRWRAGLPLLVGPHVVLREVRTSDAAALCQLLGAPEVQRFLSPPPSSESGFARFIDRADELRADGRGLCFAVTLRGHDDPIGLFQLRQTEPGFQSAEWGFAVASAFWGTGVFEEAAQLVMTFAFEHLGVHRLEARAVVSNGRGISALTKIGAVQEGVLRRSFHRDGEYLDQALFTVVGDEWRASRRKASQIVH